ncbi:MAG: hypothetical protein AAGA54_35895 [Myxococcota bacterium]
MALLVATLGGCDKTSEVTGVAGAARNGPGDGVYVVATVEPAVEGAAVSFRRQGEGARTTLETDWEGRAKYTLDGVDLKTDVVLIEVGAHTARVELSDLIPKEPLALAYFKGEKWRSERRVTWVVKSELGDFLLPQGVSEPELLVEGVQRVAIVGREPLEKPLLDLDDLMLEHVASLSPDEALDRELSDNEAHFEVELELTSNEGEVRTVKLEIESKSYAPVSVAASRFMREVMDGRLVAQPPDDAEVAIYTLYDSIVGKPRTFAEIDYFTRATDVGEPRPTKRTCSYRSGPDVKIVLQDQNVQLVSTRDQGVVAEKIFPGKVGKCPFQVGVDQSGVSMGPDGRDILRWTRSQRKSLSKK